MEFNLIFKTLRLVCTLFIKLYEVRLVNKLFLNYLDIKKVSTSNVIWFGKNIQGVRNHLSQEVY